MPRFENWARTVVTRPREKHVPGSETELCEILGRTRGRVRVVGGAHSWSRINAPEDVWVSLDRLRGVTLDGDRAIVAGGTRLHDVIAELDARGMALPIVGSISAQSIAGAIATGTHGSSLIHGNLASCVTGLRVVTPATRELTHEGPRVHLGALGVVTGVTLNIVPAFGLAETVEDIAIGELGSRIQAIARSAEYVKVWWMPNAARAQIFRYERTQDRGAGRPAMRRRLDNALHRSVFPIIARLGAKARWNPAITRLVVDSFRTKRRVGPGWLMLSTPMPFRHRETEGAVAMARAGEAIDRLVAAQARAKLLVNFPLEIRFVKGDGAWASPAYGGDVCQIGAYAQGTVEPYFELFWREMRAVNARPHWGKEMDHTHRELAPLYPALDQFVALRDELDPQRRFSSAFHDRVLG
ncbi:MAG TPA: D-arabinono-1,4-lactone oxidase [Kofleriaceae bacterium]